MPRSIPLLCFLAAAISIANVQAAEPRVISVLDDFSAAPLGPYQKGFIDSWRWTDAQRAELKPRSRLEITARAAGVGRELNVRIDDARVVPEPGIPLIRLAPHFPPEADAVRVRLQVTAGEVALYLGGPTAYYANSDVFTEPRKLKAENPPRFVDVDFSLNHPLWRNYRRAGFSTDAPRNYYTRWAQEPVGVYVAASTKGEFTIAGIELLALGEGRPFPRFKPEQVRRVQTIADFETDAGADGDLARTFTLYMAAAEIEWFAESWKRSKPQRFPPQRLLISAEGLGGKFSLVAAGPTAEEVHCTGVRTTGAGEANAVCATLRLRAPQARETLAGQGPALPIDFLVFVAPPEKKFPWDRFGPSPELRAAAPDVRPGFDYNLTHRTLQSVTDVDFAIYQTRRYVKPDEWSTLVMPTADFTCVYGHGSYRSKFIDQEPLSCGDVIAVAWLNPWCRAGRRTEQDETAVDELSFAQVPGTPEELRSYWQVDDVKSLVFRESGQAAGRTRRVALPSDPPPLTE